MPHGLRELYDEESYKKMMDNITEGGVAEVYVQVYALKKDEDENVGGKAANVDSVKEDDDKDEDNAQDARKTEKTKEGDHVGSKHENTEQRWIFVHSPGDVHIDEDNYEDSDYAEDMSEEESSREDMSDNELHVISSDEDEEATEFRANARTRKKSY
ncbi:hypothetical protein ABZP36_034157 [Zizania latifolia]